MKVLVIGGGNSNEREVSLMSARYVCDGAKDAGYHADFYDWDGSVEWLDKNLKYYDVVLPILHGEGGEDGEIQMILESNQVRYLGSGPIVAKKCFDKQQIRKFAKSLKILVPNGDVLGFDEYKSSKFFDRPHVVKPVEGGSGIDSFVIKDLAKRDINSVEETFKKYRQMLIEECIDGQEITVGVLDSYKELPVVEIIPPVGELFDFENKYNGRTTELCPPENISEELQLQAKAVAKHLHQELGCKHITRSDFMIEDNKLYFLEINIIPGLTDQSLFPKAAKAAGLEFPQLVDHLVKLVANQK